MPNGWTGTHPILVDTNVLIYAFDSRDPRENEVASRLLLDLSDQGRLVLGAQVLNEFYSVGTRPKRGPGLDHRRAVSILQNWIGTTPILPVNSLTTRTAFEGVELHGLSWWDALLWATARLYRVPTLLSEDYQHGRTIDGVQYLNPFAQAAEPPPPAG